MTGQNDSTSGESPVGLLSDVVAGFGRLLRGELALARAEAKRSFGAVTSALVKLMIAAILGITALNVLSGAAIAALVAAGLSPPWASVAIGAALLLAVFGLVRTALAELTPANLAPKRMMDNLRHDAEILKSMVISDATSNNRR